MSDVGDDRLTTQLGDVSVVAASRDDAVAILRLRDALANWMLERGIDQWRPGEMSLAWIEECAGQGWVFVARRDANLIASVTLVWSDPFIWGDLDGPGGYIHMLMVDRGHAHLGLGRSLLDWAESRIKRSGHHRARLDCVRTNVALRAYYEDAGYALVGYRDFDSVPAVALYEKPLTAESHAERFGVTR